MTGRTHQKRATGNTRGNALFLILIGVALFAALSYAVTQSGRGGSGGISQEQNMLKAAEVANYLAAIRNAITRLTLTGCSETQLDFENTVYIGGQSGPYSVGQIMYPPGNNASSPTDQSCDIFNAAGGGVTARIISGTADAAQCSGGGCWAEPGHIWFSTDVVPGVGTGAPELLAVLTHIPAPLCAAYNKLQTGNDGSFYNNTNWINNIFTGSYVTENNIGPAYPSDPVTWCSGTAAPVNRHIITVLLVR